MHAYSTRGLVERQRDIPTYRANDMFKQELPLLWEPRCRLLFGAGGWLLALFMCHFCATLQKLWMMPCIPVP
jgi:hypothetical protein